MNQRYLQLLVPMMFWATTAGAQEMPRPFDDDRRPPAAERRQPRRATGQQHAQQYSIEQALSDQAQLHTIAFSGLAFMTGDFGASSFIPPGKVADFFGFQYMRDSDAAGKGHNPMFLDRVAGNLMRILTADQRRLLEQAAREQEPLFREIAVKRLPLIAAFHQLLEGRRTGLSRSAVRAYGAELFRLDAQLSFQRARLFGRLASGLSAGQKQALASMKFGDFRTWPAIEREQVRQYHPRGASKLVSVGYMTLASEFFSWYAGSVEADTYFCPERHGTYFGGFYLKDMPAMGKRDYDISTSLTGDSGAAFMELLNDRQRAAMLALIEQQRGTMREIVQVRRTMATRLRGFLSGAAPAEQEILSLGSRYGQLDAELAYGYATTFATIYQSMSASQKEQLMRLRSERSRENGTAFIYSDRIQMPQPPDSSFLFQSP